MDRSPKSNVRVRPGERNKQRPHELDLALRNRYIVVVRSLISAQAEAVDEKTFRGGARIFEALLFDLQAQAPSYVPAQLAPAGLLFPNLSNGHGKLEPASRREDRSTAD